MAVYRYAPAGVAADRRRALVFVHGGPGGYVRDFDRDFFRGFSNDGFEVVLYDQFGAGRSPLGDAGDHSHDRNIDDRLAVLTRVNKPAMLVGQSYGATLVTSALANPDVRKRVSHVVLSEPGKIPGATFSSSPGAAVGRQSRASATPDLHDLAAPVLLLGKCSYIPRGRAMEYFDVYRIARSNLIPGVGHITWGNARGQALTRDAITRFVDDVPGPVANEPTRSTRQAFVASGR